MSFSSTTIGAILDQINRTIYLPAIQRPFVWKQQQCVYLFDSLLKGYHIGTFMFWRVEEETKSRLVIYRFLEDYSGEMSMNERAETQGRAVTLVIDGQQRLTSLLVGLRGTFAVKRKRSHASNPDNWERQTLYVDLLKDPDYDEDDDEEDELARGISYGLKFFTTPPRNAGGHLWFRVGAVLEAPNAAALDRLEQQVLDQLPRDATFRERELVLATLRRLHAAIWKEQWINAFTETNQDPDRVLDIFIRSNSSGEKLKKADYLMSMITSLWQEGSAREEVERFRKHLAVDLPLPNSVRQDFLMKSLLVLNDFEVKFLLRNFTAEAVRTIERNWGKLKQALENAYRLLNAWGIGAENLTSRNAVLPIAYYLFKTPEFTFRGTTRFEEVNAGSMRHWLLQALLVGAFGGSSDGTLAKARNVIRDSLKSDRNFPAEKLFAALGKGNRLAKVDERYIDEILDAEYGSAKAHLALALLQPDLDWKGTTYHVDHIIPEADASVRILRGQMLQEHQISRITAAVKRLGNLQLLAADENLEKHDLPFASWIESRRSDYKERHMIPDRYDLWRASKLPEFVAEREELIRARLREISGLTLGR